MFFIGQSVHIRGAFDGSARYDPAMSDDERRGFPNLVLMCKPHHQLIDVTEPGNYPAEFLQRWKVQREAIPREALERLREVTPSGRRRIVADGVRDHDAKVEQAVDRLQTSDHEAAGLMGSLLDELTEAYSRLRDGIDPDTVDALYSATQKAIHPGELHQSRAYATAHPAELRRVLGNCSKRLSGSDLALLQLVPGLTEGFTLGPAADVPLAWPRPSAMQPR